MDEQTAPIFGELKSRLKREKQLSRRAMRKHNIDIMLASTAIGASATLIGMDRIYHDIAEFNPLFRFENWLVPPQSGEEAAATSNAGN